MAIGSGSRICRNDTEKQSLLGKVQEVASVRKEIDRFNGRSNYFPPGAFGRERPDSPYVEIELYDAKKEWVIFNYYPYFRIKCTDCEPFNCGTPD